MLYIYCARNTRTGNALQRSASLQILGRLHGASTPSRLRLYTRARIAAAVEPERLRAHVICTLDRSKDTARNSQFSGTAPKRQKSSITFKRLGKSSLIRLVFTV